MILHHLKFIDKIITIIAFLEMRIRCEKSQDLNLFKILFAKILGMKQIFYAFIFFIFATKLNLKSNLWNSIYTIAAFESLNFVFLCRGSAKGWELDLVLSYLLVGVSTRQSVFIWPFFL